MNIVKLTEDNYFGVFSEAEKILNDGGIVAGPTDTVYGLFGRADNPRTIKKIFAAKKRPFNKPLSVFIKDVLTARRYAYISDAKADFLKKVWPGPVTVVFHHKDKLPKILTGSQETLALRQPDNHLLAGLLEKVNFPLAQTSANLSGRSPAKNIDELQEYFAGEKQQPDLLIDGGKIEGQPSVVIDFTGSKPVVLRTGLISKNDFDQMLSSML